MATINTGIFSYLAASPLLGDAAGEGVLEAIVHSALVAEGFADSGQATEEEAAKAALKHVPTQLFGLKRFEDRAKGSSIDFSLLGYFSGKSEKSILDPFMTPLCILTRWIKGEKLHYSSQLTHALFYNQVRFLLNGLGVDTEGVKAKIVAVVFEERGWKRESGTQNEKLLLLARELVAEKWGGVLPFNAGIAGIPLQGKQASLTRWINGEEIALTPALLPQIRALLVHDGTMSEADADALIAAAQI